MRQIEFTFLTLNERTNVTEIGNYCAQLWALCYYNATVETVSEIIDLSPWVYDQIPTMPNFFIEYWKN